MTPDQVKELLDALRAMESDPAWAGRIVVLPLGQGPTPQMEELVFLVHHGLMSVDEARLRLGLQPWGMAETAELVPWALLPQKVVERIVEGVLGL